MKNTYKIAIVVSEFNRDITKELLNGALLRLENKIEKNNISVYWVPGAVEIPYATQCLARKKIYDAIITLGAIIYGETDHYHYVCQQVSNGCQRVMLDENIPVIFGVLTVQTKKLALDRVGGSKGHMGIETADTMIKMLDFKNQLRE